MARIPTRSGTPCRPHASPGAPDGAGRSLPWVPVRQDWCGFESPFRPIWSGLTVRTTERFMRFGILAHSSEGAALCFLEFCRNGFREAHHMHPDVMLDCEAMGHIMSAWDAGDHAGV